MLNSRPNRSVNDTSSSHHRSSGRDQSRAKDNGRKRHLMVDTLGLLIVVVVSAANVQDRDGAVALLLKAVRRRRARLAKIWADNGYHGEYGTGRSGNSASRSRSCSRTRN